MNLTVEQQQALGEGEPVTVNVGGRECVLLTRQAYERVKNLLYDDSPWTDEEMDLLAAESADLCTGDVLDIPDIS